MGGTVKSNGKIAVTRQQAVDRALHASKDNGMGYRLGAGGRDPRALWCYDKLGKVDCSGFVAWALGYDRLQVDADGDPLWLNTDVIYRDSKLDKHWFRHVEGAVLPGDLLVYPGVYKNGERKPGHVGIITKVLDGFQRAEKGQTYWWKHLLVAHATPSHRVKHGNVVALTDARVWSKRGYIVRYLGFQEA